MNTLFVSFGDKVSIQCVAFSYYNCYANTGKDMFTLTFASEQQCNEQCKLLDEYHFEYKVLHVEPGRNYPYVVCYIDYTLQYSVTSVKEFKIWFSNHDLRRYHEWYFTHINNKNNVLTLIPEHPRLSSIVCNDFIRKGFPADVSSNGNIEITDADIWDIKVG